MAPKQPSSGLFAGLNKGHIVTKKELPAKPSDKKGVEKWIDPNTGQSTGRINHPDSLLRAVEALVNKSQVNVVAVVARFPGDDIAEYDDYRQGKRSRQLQALLSDLQFCCLLIPELKGRSAEN